jgi:hypothetical protein
VETYCPSESFNETSTVILSSVIFLISTGLLPGVNLKSPFR